MRKLIILASLLGVCVSEMEAQSVVALHSGGNTFILSSFESALKMAKTNDTINLPAGEINLGEEFTLNKGVHIFGVGYNPNANKLNQTTKLLGKKLIISSEAEGGSISGIEFKGDISIGSSGKEMSRFDISRCYLNDILQTANSSYSLSFILTENVVNSILGSDEFSYFVVALKSNIISGTLKYVNVIAYNNIFLNKASDDYLFNTCFLNLSYNIFLAEKFASNPDEFLECSKNVFTQNTDFSDNLKNIPLNQIFNESVTTNFDYTFNMSADYHLIPNSPAKELDTINDPGIYGSDTPAKEMGVTSQPQIYDLKLSEMPNIDGKIKLKAVIKAQQN